MNKKLKILVTGSNGFIGSKLKEYLKKDKNLEIWELTRNKNHMRQNVNFIYLKSFLNDFDLTENLSSIDCIIHLAAIAHNNSKSKNDIFQVNAKSVEKLAIQAEKAGVKRFIFLSSIKVYGETTHSISFDEKSRTNPITSYAQAKLYAEKKLIQLARNSSISYTIIRLPLVYGNKQKGNLKKLIGLLNFRLPIPLIKEKNLRSIIAIDNLNNFLYKCIISDISKNNIYCLSDGKDISLSELINLIAEVKKLKTRTFYIKKSILLYIFKFIGHQTTFDSLYSSFRLNSNKAIKELNWRPLLSTEEAFRKYFN